MARKSIEVESLIHDATRKNIPTAEFESLMRDQDKTPIQLAYERRNRDLDPQLVWRGKDEQDWSDLIVQAPPLYIQEKVHPKVIIDDLKRQTADRARAAKSAPQADMFADFNGLPDAEAATEFYQHDQHWSNRMISGDSLSVMASLAEREGLRGQVQCIYVDPPYGIKFNSNFQWSTTNNNPVGANADILTREPEQVRAFRDTWKDGIHSYLTYLRDRLTVARDLLSQSGSLFLQISDENVHRVRVLMDEVFGEDNFISIIPFRKKTMPFGARFLEQMNDFILWYGKNKDHTKYRQLYVDKDVRGDQDWVWYLDVNGDFHRMDPEQHQTHLKMPENSTIFRMKSLEPSGVMDSGKFSYNYQGKLYGHPKNGYGTTVSGMKILEALNRLQPKGNFLNYRLFLDDYPVSTLNTPWNDTVGADNKQYVVQTNTHVVKRCMLMTSDPGDLVLDPTCGSGTTAYVAEQWGRRWITIDTSRVAVALARSRLMGARYPYYLLADSVDGQRKEGEITHTPPKSAPTHGSIRQGFVYDRVPHITLKSIANNAEIDVIWERMQPGVDEALDFLNDQLRGHDVLFKVETGGRAGKKIDFRATGTETLPSGEAVAAGKLLEWEVPRVAPRDWPASAQACLPKFWHYRILRQKEIDASISAKAEFEFLYDKPFADNGKTRVAGPFTVESLSPHRTLAVDWDDELIDTYEAAEGKRKKAEAPRDFTDFAHMILENLKAAGVQQAHKEDRITFASLKGWPGNWIAAEGPFIEGDTQRRAGVFIGPEFGTVSRPDLVAAAREAGDAGFDVLIACAFNYDAHSSEFDKLGRIRVLKARMNPDLHMGGDLKTTGAGNLFVIFGEPDIRITDAGDGMVQVQVFGVDVFKPQTGEVQSEGTDGIALWMLDTDYNEESFFVRHAYFLGANDPYKALKTTLKAEIDEEAWESLYSDTSRPFAKPKSGRIAVKVINHLGDEVMKVFAVE